MADQPRDESGKFGTKPPDPDAPRKVASFKCSANELAAIDAAAKAAGTTRQGWVLGLIRKTLGIESLPRTGSPQR